MSSSSEVVFLKGLKNIEDVGDGSVTKVFVLLLGQFLKKLAALGVIVLVSVADEIH